jgi:hypothetical protein
VKSESEILLRRWRKTSLGGKELIRNLKKDLSVGLKIGAANLPALPIFG